MQTSIAKARENEMSVQLVNGLFAQLIEKDMARSDTNYAEYAHRLGISDSTLRAWLSGRSKEGPTVGWVLANSGRFSNSLLADVLRTLAGRRFAVEATAPENWPPARVSHDLTTDALSIHGKTMELIQATHAAEADGHISADEAQNISRLTDEKRGMLKQFCMRLVTAVSGRAR